MGYFLDATQMTVSGAPGTGAITLGVAVAGYQTFATAGVVSGQLISYAIQDVNGAFEYGRGTYSSSGPTLTRTTVLGSSAAGSAITATSAAIVSAVSLAEDIAPIPYLRGFLGGLVTSNDGTAPNTVIDVSAGTCIDSTNAVMINLGAFTKSTAGTWVAGTGNNGMGTGLTVTASTWYHAFSIINSGTPDVYFDTSVSANNAPAGTTSFRRIGSFKTDGSAHILPFTQFGDDFIWALAVQDANFTLGTALSVTTLASVPLGVIVNAKIRVGITHSTVIVAALIWPVVESSSAYNTPSGNSSISANVAGDYSFEEFPSMRTNTSQQINIQGSHATMTCAVYTYGWTDTRGRFS